MSIRISNGSLKRLRKTPWRFQRTFATPLKSLPSFVSTILSALKAVQRGEVVIDAIVFEPRHLYTLLSANSLPLGIQGETCIEAEGPTDVEALLIAALGDPVDFWFVPTPKTFVIYADHDEYATFFAISKSNLNMAVMPLLEKGFKPVEFERVF